MVEEDQSMTKKQRAMILKFKPSHLKIHNYAAQVPKKSDVG